jgi:hypothetical protein
MIKLELKDINEVNLVLNGLGKQPYANVFDLINRIGMQVEKQLNQKDNSKEKETK